MSPSAYESLLQAKAERLKQAAQATNWQSYLAIAPLHPAQHEIATYPTRYKVVNCGRRFGKTQLAVYLALDALLQGLSVSYWSSSYRNIEEFWQRIKALLLKAPELVVTQHNGKLTMTLTTHGELECWSLNNPDTVRGRDYDLAIIDEAAQVPDLEYAWNHVIRAFLIDRQGKAIFLSTPRGQNFFRVLYGYGLDPEKPDWANFHYPSIQNPMLPPGEIESARAELPDRAFREEYLAEFVEDSGVFRGVNQVSILDPTEPIEGHQYAFGVDWAKSYDFTVISVIDTTTKQQVYLDRFNMISWELQRGRLKALYDRYHPSVVYAESNSIGDVNIEALQNDGLPVRGFETTANTKGPLIDALALAIERGDITLLDNPVQRHELQAYQLKRLPSGRFQYSAPEGMHDDTVIALALSWYAAQRPLIMELLTF